MLVSTELYFQLISRFEISWKVELGWLVWSHNAAGATSPRACNHALAAKFQHDNNDDEEEEEHVDDDDDDDDDDDKGADYGRDDNRGFFQG